MSMSGALSLSVWMEMPKTHRTVTKQGVRPTHVYLTTDNPIWLKADWRRGLRWPSTAGQKWSPWWWVITAVKATSILLAPVWLGTATMMDELSMHSTNRRSHRPLFSPFSWHALFTWPHNTGPSCHPTAVLIVSPLFLSSEPQPPPSVPSSVLLSPAPLPLSCGQLRSASVITWNSRCSINWREIWWDKDDGG